MSARTQAQWVCASDPQRIETCPACQRETVVERVYPGRRAVTERFVYHYTSAIESCEGALMPPQFVRAPREPLPQQAEAVAVILRRVLTVADEEDGGGIEGIDAAATEIAQMFEGRC